MVYTILSLLALSVIATAHAVKDEYLVVLRWPDHWFFLEMQGDGRYVVIHWARVPAAIVGYAAASVASALHSAFDRVRGRSSHLPVAAHLR